MKTTALVMVAAVLLTGCAGIEPQHFVGPNKGDAYSMECSAMGRTMNDCYRKAGELCPNGYTILGQQSQLAGMMQAGAMFVPAMSQTLAIECR